MICGTKEIGNRMAAAMKKMTRSNIKMKVVSNFQAPARHSNDSHQCPILAADFVIICYGIENGQAIQAGEGSE